MKIVVIRPRNSKVSNVKIVLLIKSISYLVNNFQIEDFYTGPWVINLLTVFKSDEITKSRDTRLDEG